VDSGDRPGVSTEDSIEIKKLKAENKRLREDVEILRAATVFFAGELDPRNR
jgi:transposase